jgi:hypothetical protein
MGTTTMHLKVGLADQPYTADYEVDETVTTDMKTFTHDFTPAQNDARVGIAFDKFMGGSGNRINFDNVWINKN